MNSDKQQRPIMWLVIVHILVGLFCTWAAYADPGFSLGSFSFGILLVAQLALLGCWGGLSNMLVEQRMVCVLIGHIFLIAEFTLILDVDGPTYIGLVSTMLGCSVGSLSLKWWCGPSQYYDRNMLQQFNQPWQFSIGQLMILTLVVSCALVVRSWIESLAEFGPTFTGVGAFAFLVFCLVTITLACTWAMLSLGSPWVRTVAVLIVIGYVSHLWAFAMGDEITVPILILMGHALVVLATLFVVRRSGYRLMLPPALPATEATRPTPTNSSEGEF